MAQRKVNCEVYTDRGIVGKNGADGKSAYQQAVEGGYQGTEEEFEQALASDIATVANNVTNINVVGNNIENVNTAVDNMSAIIAAPTAATQAEASASQAATSATNAQTSETNSATSASNAAESATNASASAAIATTKASEATSSATSASASANSASASATSASISAANAEIWAEGTDAQLTTLGGEHSSKVWANVSKQYAESIGAATADTLGLVKPDGNTITVTEDGTISATVGSGSGFDFEGKKAEFDAAVAAGTITADSVSLITDDVDGANVATKAELQAVDRSKADTALSNLSDIGRENIKQSLSNYAIRFPDYESVVTIKSGATTSKQQYIAPQDGWISYTLFERIDTTNIVASVDTPGKGAVVWINGNRISEVANWNGYVHYTTSYLFHPVKEGDIIDYYIQAQGYLYFYPMLGAN